MPASRNDLPAGLEVGRTSICLEVQKVSAAFEAQAVSPLASAGVVAGLGEGAIAALGGGDDEARAGTMVSGYRPRDCLGSETIIATVRLLSEFGGRRAAAWIAQAPDRNRPGYRRLPRFAGPRRARGKTMPHPFASRCRPRRMSRTRHRSCTEGERARSLAKRHWSRCSMSVAWLHPQRRHRPALAPMTARARQRRT